MNFRQMSHFKQRLIVSSIALAALFLAISLATHPWFKPFYTLLICSIIGTAVWEYYQIALSKGLHPLEKWGIGISVAYLIALALQSGIPHLALLPALVIGLGLLACFLYYFASGLDPFVNLAVTFFAILYLTIPLGCILLLTYFPNAHGIQDGRPWLLYLIGVTKMTDIGGYFFGKLIGRKKMAPVISPKKTWEGSIGGLTLGVATSLGFYLFNHYFFHSESFQLTLSQSLWLGFLMGILAQVGDLSESLLKRDGGVKDSNHLPGLGGVLDILDSLVFTSPLLYIFLFMNS